MQVIKESLAFLKGGTSSFNEPELLLLNSVVNQLPKEEAEVLTNQIESVSLVQRHNPGRLVSAYYSKGENVPTLPYLGYEYCLAEVIFKLDHRALTAGIILHNGKLMTLERNVPLEKKQIKEIVKVVLHPQSSNTISEEIDAEEHGKNA